MIFKISPHTCYVYRFINIQKLWGVIILKLSSFSILNFYILNIHYSELNNESASLIWVLNNNRVINTLTVLISTEWKVKYEERQ